MSMIFLHIVQRKHRVLLRSCCMVHQNYFECIILHLFVGNAPTSFIAILWYQVWIMFKISKASPAWQSFSLNRLSSSYHCQRSDWINVSAHHFSVHRANDTLQLADRWDDGETNPNSKAVVLWLDRTAHREISAAGWEIVSHSSEVHWKVLAISLDSIYASPRRVVDTIHPSDSQANCSESFDWMSNVRRRNADLAKVHWPSLGVLRCSPAKKAGAQP